MWMYQKSCMSEYLAVLSGKQGFGRGLLLLALQHCVSCTTRWVAEDLHTHA